MSTARCLIVNADDFGQSPGVNRGIVQCHEQGIVTSASLMVRWPAAKAAADYASSRPDFSIGLHVDLGEWACNDGEWKAVYEVVDTEDAKAVSAEVARQLALFRDLVGRNPSHIDSHQHVHRSEPLRALLGQIARDLQVPLRHFSAIRYCGDFYGQLKDGDSYPEGISRESLIGILASLPVGVTELCCHPGLDEDVDSVYRSERASEVQVLCDPQVRHTLGENGIELRSFRELDRLQWQRKQSN